MQKRKRLPVDASALYFSQRLTRALYATLKAPLTIVQAPMGYGKTVAVRKFLRSRHVRLVWTSIISSSEDAFWRMFCQEMKRSLPQSFGVPRLLLTLGFPYDSVKMNEARELMQRMTFDEPTVLVFDDCHLLPSQSFKTFCQMLARDHIDNLHIVCITRDAYAGREELASLKGSLRFIGQEKFTLNTEEIKRYYLACGLSLREDEADELHGATGGWISALYLYLLRYIQHGGVSQPAGVDALLENEIYAPLARECKDLLFALQPLERFTIAQANFLYGDDTRTILTELCRKNSFITFEHAGQSFAIHSLFRQYLAGLFAELPEDRKAGIYAKCGEWFVTRNEVAAAMEIYYTAGDFEQALTVLEKDMSRNLVTENAAFFTKMFKACPEDVLERHIGAAFKYAIAAFSASDFPAFAAQCAWLAKRCATLPPDDADADIWRGELEFLYSLAAYNDIKAMSAHHRKANVLLGRPTRLFGTDSPWTLGSPSVLFMFHRQSGKLADELRQMKECLPHYYQLASYHGAGGEYLMEAEALYHAGDFMNAGILCHKAEIMASQHNQLSNVLCAMFMRLRLELVEGRPRGAQRMVESMRRMIKKSRDYFLLHTVDLCEGWLYATMKQPENIPPWLYSELGEDNRLYAFAKGFYYIVHGRILLLEKQYSRVLGMFGYLLESGMFQKNLLFSIYAHIYLAIAHQSLGNAFAAIDDLQTALDLAMPDMLHMPFAENYDLLAPAARALGRGRRPGNIALVFKLAKAFELRKPLSKAAKPISSEAPLSEREIELAKLGASDLPFKVIAEQLALAPDTVKKSFSIMYKKLEVNSRKELIKKLAKLGLVEAPEPEPRPVQLPPLKKRKKVKSTTKTKKPKKITEAEDNGDD